MKKDVEQGQIFLSHAAVLPADATAPKLKFLVDHTVTFFYFQTHNETCNVCPVNYYSGYEGERRYQLKTKIHASALKFLRLAPECKLYLQILIMNERKPDVVSAENAR